jgi:hypothetical protein
MDPINPAYEPKVDPNNPELLYTATIGYRSQPKEGGFLFRIGFTPLFDFSDFILPWIGLSVGTTL